MSRKSEKTPFGTLRLFQEDSRARTCLLQAREGGSGPLEADSSLRQRELLGRYALRGSSLRTSRGCFHRTRVKTSLSSSKRLPNSGTAWPGECWIASISEWPNDAVVFSLSDILETGDVPQKFYLSPKACRGILRRAEKRGRELPSALRSSLEQTAQAEADLQAQT